MWKMERFLFDQPQMFLEPSGISDSGVFSQSTFSELQSEEDKGNYQFVVVVFFLFLFLLLLLLLLLLLVLTTHTHVHRCGGVV